MAGVAVVRGVTMPLPSAVAVARVTDGPLTEQLVTDVAPHVRTEVCPDRTRVGEAENVSVELCTVTVADACESVWSQTTV